MVKEWSKCIVDKQTKKEISNIPEWKIMNYCKDTVKKCLKHNENTKVKKLGKLLDEVD